MAYRVSTCTIQVDGSTSNGIARIDFYNSLMNFNVHRHFSSSRSLRLPSLPFSLPSSIMSASLSLVRFGHFFWSPTPPSTPLSSPASTPFHTPPSSPRALNSLNNGIDITIFDGLVGTIANIHGPPGDIGGPTWALADEVADAVHKPHCGCYWCCRGAYLQVHFARPDDPPEEPAPPLDPLPTPRSFSSSSSFSEPPVRFFVFPDLSPPPRVPVQNRTRWHHRRPYVGMYFDC